MPRKLSEKPDDTPEEPLDRASDHWSDDQTRRRYYYDDAHGYQPYMPEAGDDPDDNDDKDEVGPPS